MQCIHQYLEIIEPVKTAGGGIATPKNLNRCKKREEDVAINIKIAAITNTPPNYLCPYTIKERKLDDCEYFEIKQ